MQLAIFCVFVRSCAFIALCNWSQEQKVKKRGMGRCAAGEQSEERLQRPWGARRLAGCWLLLLAHREEMRMRIWFFPVLACSELSEQWTSEVNAWRRRSSSESALFENSCFIILLLILSKLVTGVVLYVRSVAVCVHQRTQEENRDETTTEAAGRQRQRQAAGGRRRALAREEMVLWERVARSPTHTASPCGSRETASALFLSQHSAHLPKGPEYT